MCSERRAEGLTTPMMSLCALSQSSLKPNSEKKNASASTGWPNMKARVDPDEDMKGKSE